MSLRVVARLTFGCAKADDIQSVVDGLARDYFSAKDEPLRIQYREALGGALEACALG